MRVTSWFEGFREQRAALPGSVTRDVEVPGLGVLHRVRSVDCLGDMCPRPQLLTLKVLGEIEPGGVIEVLSDNPAAVEGFPALAQALNCTYLTTVRVGDFWRVYLRKEFGAGSI